MRYSRSILLALMLMIASLMVVTAQESFGEFRWYEGDLALRYPTDWQNPTSAILDGRPSLSLQQDDVHIFITVYGDVSADTDLYALLDEQMRALDIRPTGPLPMFLLGYEGIGTLGVSADNVFYGTGRIATLDNRAVLITGRGLRETRADFISLFEAIAGSLLLGADSVIAPLSYGVVWSVESYAFAGEDAFIDSLALVYQSERLYLLDSVSGIFIFDVGDGTMLERIPLEPDFSAESMAIGTNGTIYVGDTGCGCIQRYSGGRWLSPLIDLSIGAPISLIADSAGRIWATDFNDEGDFFLRVFADGQMIAEYGFNEALYNQPLLVADDMGNVIAITSDGDVFAFDGNVFTLDYHLNAANAVYRAGAFTSTGSLAVATAMQGIFLFDENGEVVNRIGRLVVAFPMAGEVVAPSGIAFGDDGTLYWVDSDGAFGRLTAVSADIEAGRVGSSIIALGDIRQGRLSNARNSQIWTLDAEAGQETQIRIIADIFDPMDVVLHIIAPNGQEATFDTTDEDAILTTPFDILVDSFTFSQSGIYSLVVERLSGEGVYSLGLTRQENLDFNAQADERIEVRGRIEDARIFDRWVFSGDANVTVTITLETQDFLLDPLLRLYDANGTLLDENDDAEDISLGLNAQIARFVLPRNGDYIIEATRFDGVGGYILTLEVVQEE